MIGMCWKRIRLLNTIFTLDRLLFLRWLASDECVTDDQLEFTSMRTPIDARCGMSMLFFRPIVCRMNHHNFSTESRHVSLTDILCATHLLDTTAVVKNSLTASLRDTQYLSGADDKRLFFLLSFVARSIRTTIVIKTSVLSFFHASPLLCCASRGYRMPTRHTKIQRLFTYHAFLQPLSRIPATDDGRQETTSTLREHTK